MPVRGLDHVNIVTPDVAGTVAFYEDVVGLTSGERPNFSFPGAWLYAGGRAVIHLMGGERGRGTGSLDHVAFEAEDFDGTKRRLEERGLAYEARDVPGSRVRQLFVLDPNGVKLELNFPR
jgi:catechol 2,3-dioxygenase-like lactoylglutathione lyase family enzyme